MLRRLNPITTVVKSVLLLLFVGSSISALPQPVNTSLSNGIFFDSEPFIAINPTNPQNIVVAWMGEKLSGCLFLIGIKTVASFDGGTTWSSMSVLPHMGTGFHSADVSMAFDKNGVLYLAYIDHRETPDSGGIFVARSCDGGLSWDEPSKAIDMYDDPVKFPIDRPWLVADRSGTANAGTLYITSKPPSWIPMPNRAYYTVSSDGGHYWTPLRFIDSGDHLIGDFIQSPMASPAVGVNGCFYSAYPSYVPSQSVFPVFYLAQSRDRGNTFSYSTVYSELITPADTNLKRAYLLLTHPADSNRMVFLTPAMMSGDEDIQAFRSNDAGQTWSGPVRVNDDAQGNGKEQDMVWGAYNQQGDLVVTWRDRRDATTGGFWDAGYNFYYATSRDNGATFSANHLLSSQFIAFDSIIALDGNDFMSCEYCGDTLYSAWGDTRDGMMNVYFAKTEAGTNTSIEIKRISGGDDPLHISPNPCSDRISISAHDSWIGKEISVFTASGKKILTTTLTANPEVIDTRDFPSGVYFVRVDGSIGRFLKR